MSSRALAAAGALSLMLAAAAFQSLAGEHAPVASPVRSSGLSHDRLLSLPPAAQGPVSATLGADAPVYLVTPSKSGFAAMSPGQQLSSRFDRAGVSLSSGATRLRLSLQAVGYGSSLTALGAVTPSATANRVLYAHGALSEWYANGPLGLEQGFTVARAPSGRAAGPLTLAMALSGDTNPSLASGGQSVTFSHAGGSALRYGSLSVADARGRALHSWLQLQGGRLLLRVDTRGARYPLRIDPFIHQGEKLTVSGLAGPYGYVGMSVALSADGNTALIGAPADNSGPSGLEYHGAVWVFTRSGSTWTQQGEKLTGGGESGGGWFGQSVALSADGNTALIGAPNDDHEVGAAWVFTRSGSTWTQQGEKLTGGGEVGEGYFGRSVALSADGNTALIGGYNDNEHRGAAWVFTRSGSTWTQQGEKLTGGGGLGFFGWSVALSGEGNTALIGEWGIGGGIGAAWVFTRSGSTWAKQGGALTGGEASGYSWFGYSVALSGEGSTALIGAPHGDGYAGTGLVFTRSGATWTQQGERLTGSEEINGEFGGELGYSAALSASGNTALVGGRVDNDFHGAAWAFERSGSTWAQEGGKLTGSEESANREELGWSVALSSSGDTALVGSPCDKACVGSASVFVNSTPPPSPPEYGRCTKVAKGTGKYASAGCTTLGGKADYEWDPGAVKSGFTLTSAAVTFETVKRSKVTCTGATGLGRYTGYKAVGGVSLTLTGCERSGERCSSAGAGAGEIVSRPLEGVLGVEQLGASASQDKIGLDLFPVGRAGSLIAFSCGVSTASLRGSVIVPVKANRMSLASTLKFKASKGRQKPEGFAGEARDVLEASFDEGPFEQAGLTATVTQANEEAVEVNPVV
ncbi:MAG: hypothetical protein ABSB69_01215 [Solirubrobacteraceae bacterium]